MAAADLNPSVISLTNTFGPLVVTGPDTEVEFRDGKIHVRSGEIAATPSASKLTDTASPAALIIGDVVQDGPNAGWIYCETEKKEPFLVAPKNSGVMHWRAAMKYAAAKNAKLPTKAELKAMYASRDTGALKDTFNGLIVWYWFATPLGNSFARIQRFSVGSCGTDGKLSASSVRCVRRYSSI